MKSDTDYRRTLWSKGRHSPFWVIAVVTASVGTLAVAVAANAAAAGRQPSVGGTSNKTKPSCLSIAEQRVTTYGKPAKALIPSPSINGTKLKGKIIAFIAARAGSPSATGINQGLQQAGQAIGATVLSYFGDGTTATANQNIVAAIGRGATYFVLDGVTVAQVIGSLASAPGLNYLDVGEAAEVTDPLIAGQYAHVAFPDALEGGLEADGALTLTKCNAHILAFTYPTIPAQKAVTEGSIAEVSRLCPQCTISEVDVPLADSATAVQAVVETALTNDPSTNFILMANDLLALDAKPTLDQAKIPEAGVNCDPPNLPIVAAHQTEVIDICQPPFPFIGWFTMDEVLRDANGVKPFVHGLPVSYVGPATTINPSNPFPTFGSYHLQFLHEWRLR